VIRILIDRQHHKLSVRQGGFEFGDRLNATYSGQINVHQNHVWLLFRQGFQCAFRISPIAHQTETGRAADPPGENLPSLRVVFDYRNSYHVTSFIDQIRSDGLSLVLMTRVENIQASTTNIQKTSKHEHPENIQAPTANIQKSSRIQIQPNSENWNLALGSSLDLGSWCLDVGSPPRFTS